MPRRTEPLFFVMAKNRATWNALASAIAGVALSCGGSDEATVKERLIGDWIADLGNSSGVAYSFGEDDVFEVDLAIVSGSEADVEAYVGDYELRNSETGLADEDGTYLFLQPRSGTCPGEWTDGYFVDFVGQSLRLANEDGATVLQPASEGEVEASGIITFGCFTSEGFFPSPLRAL